MPDITGGEDKRSGFLEQVRYLSKEQFGLPLDGATDEQLEAAIIAGMGPGKFHAISIAFAIDKGDVLVPGVSEELEP